jgi:plasmid stabilization system protein ParE
MARLLLVPALDDDFDRFFDHLARHDAADIPGRLAEILRALDVLSDHPLIGRPCEGIDDHRELVIGHGQRGYLALYRFFPELDTVLVLALRSQSEAGYTER